MMKKCTHIERHPVDALQTRDQLREHFHFHSVADSAAKGGFRHKTMIPEGGKVRFWSRFAAVKAIIKGEACAIRLEPTQG